MEIRDERINNFEWISFFDEQVRRPRERCELSLSISGRLKSSDYSCPDSDDRTTFTLRRIDAIRALLTDHILLQVQRPRLPLLLRERRERPQVHVQRHLHDRHPLTLELLQQLIGKVQRRRRRG